MQVAAIDEKAGIWDGGGEKRLSFIPTTWLPVSTPCWEDGHDQVRDLASASMSSSHVPLSPSLALIT